MPTTEAETAGDFREALDRALQELDGDDRAGAVLRAANLSLRIEITDLDLVVRVARAEAADGHLVWKFEDDPAPAKLDLRMDSRTANAYLQGQESLAIAIARGRVRVAGDSRVALLYLPALRLVVEPYRRQVRERYPHLAVA